MDGDDDSVVVNGQELHLPQTETESASLPAMSIFLKHSEKATKRITNCKPLEQQLAIVQQENQELQSQINELSNIAFPDSPPKSCKTSQSEVFFGKMKAYRTILARVLAEEELQTLLNKQKEFLEIEKHLKSLQIRQQIQL
ncbi:8619_t:CDS:2 [Funneliformis caledonium]|uniref:8619_t:CDS:1 n=1 Tax=Funneliformis caledonium TaxID=1117310 RepID=A0A9N9B6A6_9GLOM|nr:8619_t:CDS:2 [Funneliformis caledonium]